MQDGSNGIKGAPVTNALDDDEVDAGGASQQAGVQSVEIAARILKALAADGRPLPLKGVAKVAGMSRAHGAVMPGVDALAAPVFDHSGKLIAVVCTFGRAGAFDSRWNGRCARILAVVTEGLSRQFGFVDAIPER